MAETARQTAYRILMRCRKNGAWSENTISSEISRAKLDGRDAALCSRIVLGVLQNRALLDFYIAGYCATPIHKLDPQVLDILRLSAYQLTQMDKIPAISVTSTFTPCAIQKNAGWDSAAPTARRKKYCTLFLVCTAPTAA